MKLYCIPYAGGSASVYHPWKAQLPADITVIPVELAGRGTRFAEPLLTDIKGMALDIFKSLETAEAYALFGHSMGGLLTYEVLQQIQKSALPIPRHVFISGCNAPDHKYEGKISTSLPDEAFMKEVADLGGTPAEVLENKEFIQLLAPIVRNDFRSLETYRFDKNSEKLKSPVSILNGRQDGDIHQKKKKWQEHCQEKCAYKAFNGGHFFIQTRELEVLAYIAEKLS